MLCGGQSQREGFFFFENLHKVATTLGPRSNHLARCFERKKREKNKENKSFFFQGAACPKKRSKREKKRRKKKIFLPFFQGFFPLLAEEKNWANPIRPLLPLMNRREREKFSFLQNGWTEYGGRCGCSGRESGKTTSSAK